MNPTKHPPDLFDEEIAYFEENFDRFLKEYPGQYLAIYKSDLIGAFPTFETATEAGHNKAPQKPVLIRVAGERPATIASFFIGPV